MAEALLVAEGFNLAVIFLTFLLIAWCTRMCRRAVSLSELSLSVHNDQVVRLDGLGVDFSEADVVSRSHFQQLLRSRQTAAPVEVKSTRCPMTVERSTFRLSPGCLDQNLVGVDFILHSSVEGKIQMFWGVKMEAIERYRRAFVVVEPTAPSISPPSSFLSSPRAKRTPSTEELMPKVPTKRKASNLGLLEIEMGMTEAQLVQEEEEEEEEAKPERVEVEDKEDKGEKEGEGIYQLEMSDAGMLFRDGEFAYSGGLESVFPGLRQWFCTPVRFMCPLDVPGIDLRSDAGLTMCPLVIVMRVNPSETNYFSVYSVVMVTFRCMRRAAGSESDTSDEEGEASEETSHLSNQSEGPSRLLEWPVNHSATSWQPQVLKHLIISGNLFLEVQEMYGDDGNGSADECVVCLCDPKEVILLPCRHLCVCHTCFKHLDKCPVCRANFMSYLLCDREEVKEGQRV